jgi:hypothetical protein
MPVIQELVEGWTGRLTFQLQNQGVNLDGTGLTVSALDLVGSDGTIVDTSGGFGWVLDTAGTVYYDPDASDFVASKSPYRVRYQIADGGGKVVWFPEGKADEIKVYARGV